MKRLTANLNVICTRHIQAPPHDGASPAANVALPPTWHVSYGRNPSDRKVKVTRFGRQPHQPWADAGLRHTARLGCRVTVRRNRAYQRGSSDGGYLASGLA